MVYTQHLKCCEACLMRVRLPPWALRKKIAIYRGLFCYGQDGSRTQEGVGKENSFPCRKLFKTEGFEGGAERRRVLAKRTPALGTVRISFRLGVNPVVNIKSHLLIRVVFVLE